MKNLITFVAFVLLGSFVTPVYSEVASYSKDKNFCENTLLNGDGKADRYDSGVFCPDTYVTVVKKTLFEHAIKHANETYLESLCSPRSEGLRIREGKRAATPEECSEVLDTSIEKGISIVKIYKNVTEVHLYHIMNAKDPLPWIESLDGVVKIGAKSRKLRAFTVWMPDNYEMPVSAQNVWVKHNRGHFWRILRSQETFSQEVICPMVYSSDSNMRFFARCPGVLAAR